MSEKLKRAFNATGKSKVEVAREAGISHQYLSRLISGQRSVEKMGAEPLGKLASALGVNANWLLGKPVPAISPTPDEIEFLRTVRAMGPDERRMLEVFVRGMWVTAEELAEDPEDDEEINDIIGYSDAEAEEVLGNVVEMRPAAKTSVMRILGTVAAGEGWDNFGERLADEIDVQFGDDGEMVAGDFIHLPEEYCGRGYSAVYVRGDSMEPTIPDGSLAIFGHKKAQPGDLALVETEDAAWVKRLASITDDYLVLESVAEYDAIIVQARDIVRCVKVLHIVKDVDP